MFGAVRHARACVLTRGHRAGWANARRCAREAGRGAGAVPSLTLFLPVLCQTEETFHTGFGLGLQLPHGPALARLTNFCSDGWCAARACARQCGEVHMRARASANGARGDA